MKWRFVSAGGGQTASYGGPRWRDYPPTAVENMQEFQKWRDLPMLPLIVSFGSKAENPT
jgi:hypothetical protein